MFPNTTDDTAGNWSHLDADRKRHGVGCDHYANHSAARYVAESGSAGYSRDGQLLPKSPHLKLSGHFATSAKFDGCQHLAEVSVVSMQQLITPVMTSSRLYSTPPGKRSTAD
jgi:hypothetical protein